MALNKRVYIEILLDTWKAPAAPPAALSALQASPLNIDFLSALLFTALWTRPPVRYGFSLSDCWAWLRYFPAIAPIQDLRLCEAWTTLVAEVVRDGDPRPGDWGAMIALGPGMAAEVALLRW